MGKRFFGRKKQTSEKKEKGVSKVEVGVEEEIITLTEVVEEEEDLGEEDGSDMLSSNLELEGEIEEELLCEPEVGKTLERETDIEMPNEVVGSESELNGVTISLDETKLEQCVNQLENRLLETIRQLVEERLPEIVREILRDEIERLRKEIEG